MTKESIRKTNKLSLDKLNVTKLNNSNVIVGGTKGGDDNTKSVLIECPPGTE